MLLHNTLPFLQKAFCISLNSSSSLTSLGRPKFEIKCIFILIFFESVRIKMGIQERIKEIEKEIGRTQKNKATTTHIGLLKSQLARLRTELLIPTNKAGAGAGGGFDVAKSGDGRVALIGFPSVGKSSLLNTVTDTVSETAAYEFTTLTCIPGNVFVNGTKIQMLDLPGIIEGAAQGKGRGREVIAVARSADLIMMVLDGAREQNNQHRDILTAELETMGIRLNRNPPGISFRKKATGGVKFNATCVLNQMGDDPRETATRILSSYRIHNAEVLFREDCSVDDFIDVIEGNRRYLRCLYVYNKIDTLSIEEVDDLARKPDSVVISIYMKLNIDLMLQRMWQYLGLCRVYTKRRGQAPDLLEPVVLTSKRHGMTVEAACKSISKELLDVFNFALIWGRSTKYNPQRVGLAHVLQDEDVLQIVPKTVAQQKRSKDYGEKVQAANDLIQKERRRLRKIKR
jgi:small GTP-binding protein